MKTYAPERINIGKIEVTKYLDKFEFGKNISINQNGKTPIFTQ